MTMEDTMSMRKTCLWMLLTLAMAVAPAMADVSNTPENGEVLGDNAFYQEPIDQPGDVDFFLVEVGPREQVYITLSPNDDAPTDLAIRVHNPNNPSVVTTEFDRLQNHAPEMEMLANDTDGSGFYILSVVERNGLTGNYVLQIEKKPIGTPVARFFNKNIWYVGEEFEALPGLARIAQSNHTYDFYCVLEINGAFFFYPDWNEDPGSASGVTLEDDRYGILNTELSFTVGPELANQGPFTFYTAGFERETGTWSNIASSPVSFRP